MACKDPEEKRRKDREYRLRYRAANREKLKAKSAKWDAENREKKRRMDRERARRKRDAAENRRCVSVSPEKAAAYRAKYRAANPEKVKASTAKWRAANPEKESAWDHARRAKRLAASGTHTAAEVKRLWDRQKHRCAVPWCDHPIAASGKNKYCVDHIIPLVPRNPGDAPGSNDISNCQILCRHHNLKKHNKCQYESANEVGLLFWK